MFINKDKILEIKNYKLLGAGSEAHCYINNNEVYKEVKDAYYPIVYGIGCNGEKIKYYKTVDIELYNSLRSRWEKMISRCYNPNDDNYPIYGALGVKVCKRWRNLSNYIDDVIDIYGFDRDMVIRSELVLDKDILQIGKPANKKVYSKKTCVWVTEKGNNPRNIRKLLEDIQRLS